MPSGRPVPLRICNALAVVSLDWYSVTLEACSIQPIVGCGTEAGLHKVFGMSILFRKET